MESNPDLEFDHYLCTKLGGMTRDEMRARMSMAEYVDWQVYYARQAQMMDLEEKKAGGR